MSTYKTARGKTVILGGISLDVGLDGRLRILVGSGDRDLVVTEAEASTLYDLLGDVMEWTSRDGATENQLERLADPQEHAMESGEADDERAASNR